MTEYILRHPRTNLLLAKKERPRNLRLGAGFGQDYKWVRNIEDATRFPCFVRAEEPAIFLDLREFEIRPVLSRGLLGDPVSREQARANGTFHSASAMSAKRAETPQEAQGEARQRGPAKRETPNA